MATTNDGPIGAWSALADVLIQRAALVCRVAQGRAPEPLAGLKVDDGDVLALLGQLPGLETGPTDAVQAIEEALREPVEEARERFRIDLHSDGPLARLARGADLEPWEAEVLGVVTAVELDPRRQRLVGYLNDDVTQRRITPWTVGQLWAPDRDYVLAISPGAGLHRAGLISQGPDAPWASAPLVVPASVLWWLVGADFDDPDLPPGAERIAARVGSSSPGAASSAGRPSAKAVVVAAGPDRRRRLQALADVIGTDECLVGRPPDTVTGWEALVRQATLSGRGMILEVDDDLPVAARDRVEKAWHVRWGISSPFDLPVSSLPRREWFSIPVDAARATAEEWNETFGPDIAVPPHRLSADQLHDVEVAARALGGDIPAAIRRLAAGAIDSTARRIHPTRSWSDLILDDARTDQVREVARRCRHRTTVFDEWGFAPEPSVGVVALFSGPSGTGKTLAAEVVAADLGVDLYKVDLANMVSKYIGETEKNLARVFDAAEAANVALFFDEADALLGKRSAVADAHDRYANIEVAYLLQRLEAHQGLVVLATNLANNLDPAFVRRMHVVVDFPVPGPAERRRIWELCLPPRAPVGNDLDLDALAKELELAGGTIRNAVLGAAFLAAERSSPIDMPVVVAALQRELHKTGRLVDVGQFEGLLAKTATSQKRP